MRWPRCSSKKVLTFGVCWRWQGSMLMIPLLNLGGIIECNDNVESSEFKPCIFRIVGEGIPRKKRDKVVYHVRQSLVNALRSWACSSCSPRPSPWWRGTFPRSWCRWPTWTWRARARGSCTRSCRAPPSIDTGSAAPPAQDLNEGEVAWLALIINWDQHYEVLWSYVNSDVRSPFL